MRESPPERTTRHQHACAPTIHQVPNGDAKETCKHQSHGIGMPNPRFSSFPGLGIHTRLRGFGFSVFWGGWLRPFSAFPLARWILLRLLLRFSFPGYPALLASRPGVLLLLTSLRAFVFCELFWYRHVYSLERCVFACGKQTPLAFSRGVVPRPHSVDPMDCHSCYSFLFLPYDRVYVCLCRLFRQSQHQRLAVGTYSSYQSAMRIC